MFILTCCAIIIHLFAGAEPVHAANAPTNDHFLGALGPLPDYIRCGMFGPLPYYQPHTEGWRERLACSEGNGGDSGIVRLPPRQAGAHSGSTVGTSRGEIIAVSTESRNTGGGISTQQPVNITGTVSEPFAFGENAQHFLRSSRLGGEGRRSVGESFMVYQGGKGGGAPRGVPSWPPLPSPPVRQPQQRPLPLSWNDGGGHSHFLWGDCPPHLLGVPRRY
ncbi:MAG: hypothetical protein Greene101449_45 [Candidatus Peregrinibacteria bacterium Greene1014_49]|nr:MAG: hypothetical protein Greene101449_45 [Candidatus Peregrinibacteria bacterium Greene1014_49]